MAKKNNGLILFLPCLLLLAACAGTQNPDDGSSPDRQSSDEFVNPGDQLGGGGIAESTPSEEITGNASDAAGAVGDNGESIDSVPEDATAVTEGVDIVSPGVYSLSGEIEGKVSVESEGVTLVLSDASITNAKKVIESSHDLTISLIGTSSILNTNADGSNAIDVAGRLTINGNGSLSIRATKNGIKANSISIYDATVSVDADKDGIHAEVDAYDEATVEPVPSYDDGGFVYVDGATLDIDTVDDGIQADTFAYFTGGSSIDIHAGGGAPTTITETSSDNASGKGIKVGAADWGADGTDIEWDGYLLFADDATFNVDSNDDALHSNAEMEILGGSYTIVSGDDAMHADSLMQISDGNIDILRCYEGIEGAKVEISGGDISVKSFDDGINAADGTTAIAGQSNPNCHIIISGGDIYVDNVSISGDGIDSNGTLLFTGGTTYVAGSTSGMDGALDSDGGILTNGGELFAVGPLGMVETPARNSSQCSVSFATRNSIAAGTILYLLDSSLNEIMSFEVPRACQSVIVSSPEITIGNSYSIYGGDTLLSEFTVSSILTSVGSSTDIGNPGGGPGGGGRPR